MLILMLILILTVILTHLNPNPDAGPYLLHRIHSTREGVKIDVPWGYDDGWEG